MACLELNWPIGHPWHVVGDTRFVPGAHEVQDPWLVLVLILPAAQFRHPRLRVEVGETDTSSPAAQLWCGVHEPRLVEVEYLPVSQLVHTIAREW